MEYVRRELNPGKDRRMTIFRFLWHDYLFYIYKLDVDE